LLVLESSDAGMAGNAGYTSPRAIRSLSQNSSDGSWRISTGLSWSTKCTSSLRRVVTRSCSGGSTRYPSVSAGPPRSFSRDPDRPNNQAASEISGYTARRFQVIRLAENRLGNAAERSSAVLKGCETQVVRVGARWSFWVVERRGKRRSACAMLGFWIASDTSWARIASPCFGHVV